MPKIIKILYNKNLPITLTITLTYEKSTNTQNIHFYIIIFVCYSYVSTMVPVKSKKEYDLLQEITVLFSETVLR